MNLCDVNVWLALTLSKHVHHRTCRSWLQTVDEPASVLFCRPTQQALLRLLTNAVVLAPYGNPPLSNKEANAKRMPLAKRQKDAISQLLDGAAGR